jgi:hypothetical protein
MAGAAEMPCCTAALLNCSQRHATDVYVVGFRRHLTRLHNVLACGHSCYRLQGKGSMVRGAALCLSHQGGQPK